MDEIREKAEKEIEKLRSDERLATLFENPRFYSEVLAQLLYNSNNPNFKMTVEDGKLKVEGCIYNYEQEIGGLQKKLGGF